MNERILQALLSSISIEPFQTQYLIAINAIWNTFRTLGTAEKSILVENIRKQIEHPEHAFAVMGFVQGCDLKRFFKIFQKHKEGSPDLALSLTIFEIRAILKEYWSES